MDLKQFFSASFRAPTNSAPVTKLLDSNDELKKTATVTNASMPSTRNKTRRSFVEHQAAQIRVQVIKESLNQFCSSHRCNLGCQSKLNLRTVMFCRSLFALLPNYKEQQQWLKAEISKRAHMGVRNKFFVEVPGVGSDRVCLDAFCLAYGMHRSWYKRNLKALTSPELHSLKPVRRDGSSDHELMFIEWLKREAQKIGDKLPHGDCLFKSGAEMLSSEHKVEIRLPYPSKEVVHNLYTYFHEQTRSTSALPPISYEDAVLVWKHHPQLRHIKLIKHKKGFSKCDKCLAYAMKIKKPMTATQRKFLDHQFYSHIAETKKERAQYAKDKVKGAEEIQKPNGDVLVGIIDAIDKWKTTFPFFVNLPKSIRDTSDLFKTKMTAVMFHGVGVHCFWASEQIVHDSNLTIECLMRSLKKVEEDIRINGNRTLPRNLHLQMDNASDNKSKQILAFMAYMVEMQYFDVIKLSYLIVSHTHEDIDQWFSVFSRFIKKILMQILTIGAFIRALSEAFKTKKCAPKCVEEIQYCYNTKPLTQFLDRHLARFDLDEKSGDKIHHFTFRRRTDGKCVMQYKLKRYTDALYPRQYNLGDIYESSVHGKGRIQATGPFKDMATKEKFWEYTICYKKDAEVIYEKVKMAAKDFAIIMFPSTASYKLPAPQSFAVAPFCPEFKTSLPQIQIGVRAIFETLQLQETHRSEMEWWDDFLANIPNSVENVQPFWLPDSTRGYIMDSRQPHDVHSVRLAIDDGVRDVDIVTHSQFPASKRRKTIAVHEAEIASANRLDVLCQGNFIVVQLEVTNASWYPWKFVIAEITEDVSGIDTTSPDAMIPILIYRPAGSLKHVSLDKPFIPWIGDNNKHFTDTVSRSMVKAVVSLTARSKCLSKHSQNLINSINF
jgi:hypothetical protein